MMHKGRFPIDPAEDTACFGCGGVRSPAKRHQSGERRGQGKRYGARGIKVIDKDFGTELPRHLTRQVNSAKRDARHTRRGRLNGL